MNEIAIVPQQDIYKADLVRDEIAKYGVTLTSTGLTFERVLSLEEAAVLIEYLRRSREYTKTIINMCLGDAYNHLDTNYHTKKEQVTDEWGEGEYHNLRNCGYVASHFPIEARRDKVRWDIYYEAAPLSEEQRLWVITEAEAGRMTRERVRLMKRADKTESLALESDKAKSKGAKTHDVTPESGPQWSNGKFGAVGDDVQKQIEIGDEHGDDQVIEARPVGRSVTLSDPRYDELLEIVEHLKRRFPQKTHTPDSTVEEMIHRQHSMIPRVGP